MIVAGLFSAALALLFTDVFHTCLTHEAARKRVSPTHLVASGLLAIGFGALTVALFMLGASSG